jgi:hypothetical protein
MSKKGTQMAKNKAAQPNKQQRALTIPRHLGVVSPTSWTPPAKSIPLAQWAACGKAFGRVKSGLHWWLGDWWAFGDFEHGERTKALADSGIDLKPEIVMNYATVCRAFQTSRRHEALSFSHHVAVASLPAREADKLLDLAERQNLSSHALREVVAKRQAGEIADAGGTIEADSDDAGDGGEVAEINPPQQHQDAAEPHDHGGARRRHTGDRQKMLLTFSQGAGALLFLVHKPAALFVGTSIPAAQLRTVALFLEHVAEALDGRVIDEQSDIAAHIADASLGAGVRVTVAPGRAPH